MRSWNENLIRLVKEQQRALVKGNCEDFILELGAVVKVAEGI